jgi:putative ABC transport system permease protein
MQGRQAFLIYLIQVGGIGLLGSIAGAILGSFIQQFLPVVFLGFLPVDTT